jgi:hypothetical protein
VQLLACTLLYIVPMHVLTWLPPRCGTRGRGRGIGCSSGGEERGGIRGTLSECCVHGCVVHAALLSFGCVQRRAALCGGGAVRTADSSSVPAVRNQRGRKTKTAAIALQGIVQHRHVCKCNSCLLRG